MPGLEVGTEIASMKHLKVALSLAILWQIPFAVPGGNHDGTAALAAQEDDYADGLVAYKNRNYKLAGEKFWASITAGNNNAETWLYLAHSYLGQKDRDQAIKTYRIVRDVYKNSREGAMAVQILKTLDPNNTWKPAAAAAEPAREATEKLPFKNRITIIPPKFGHQPVSANTVSTVRTTLAGLPPHIYKVLDENHAMVFVAPNIIDKWPEALNGPKKGEPGLTLDREISHTYGRDIYVYERAVVHDYELGPARSNQEIVHAVLTQIGHAFNDCLGVYSNKPDLQALYKMDVSEMSDADRSDLHYFLQPGNQGPAETCAHLTAVYLGSKDGLVNKLPAAFPRTARYVKAQLRL